MLCAGEPSPKLTPARLVSHVACSLCVRSAGFHVVFVTGPRLCEQPHVWDTPVPSADGGRERPQRFAQRLQLPPRSDSRPRVCTSRGPARDRWGEAGSCSGKISARRSMAGKGSSEVLKMPHTALVSTGGC